MNHFLIAPQLAYLADHTVNMKVNYLRMPSGKDCTKKAGTTEGSISTSKTRTNTSRL